MHRSPRGEGMVKRILVIDDSEIVLQALEASLAGGDYVVDLAHGGREGIARAQEHRYDLIYLDLVMPGMDGIETCRALKQLQPEAKCVFMTGVFDGDMTKREAEFLKAGGEHYFLYKPFSREEILLAAASLLSK